MIQFHRKEIWVWSFFVSHSILMNIGILIFCFHNPFPQNCQNTIPIYVTKLFKISPYYLINSVELVVSFYFLYWFLVLCLALSCWRGRGISTLLIFRTKLWLWFFSIIFFLSLTFVFISILLFTVGIVSSASSFLKWKLRSLILNLLPNIRISMYKLLSTHCFRCIPQMLMLKYLVLLSHFPCFVTHGLIVLLNSQVFDFPYICYCY